MQRRPMILKGIIILKIYHNMSYLYKPFVVKKNPKKSGGGGGKKRHKNCVILNVWPPTEGRNTLFVIDNALKGNF